MYFYNARYYDPVTGRFISADTIVPNFADPQSLNRYSYCRNNPLRYVDPTGHFSLDDFFESFLSGAVGGAVMFCTGNPMFAGMAAGAVGGAFNGGAKGALIGSVTGGIVGVVGLAGYSGLVASGLSSSAATGALIAAGAGVAGATGGWDGLASYASGLGGGAVGYYGAQYATMEPATSVGINSDIEPAAARLLARDKAYLDNYYEPVVSQAKGYGVDPTCVLGVGAESGFGTDGTYLRTGDAFGMTGGSTGNMTYATSPTDNVTKWFNAWGKQINGTGSDVSAFLNGLQGRNASGAPVPGWKVYNSVDPVGWAKLISGGITQIRGAMPFYLPLTVKMPSI